MSGTALLSFIINFCAMRQNKKCKKFAPPRDVPEDFCCRFAASNASVCRAMTLCCLVAVTDSALNLITTLLPKVEEQIVGQLPDFSSRAFPGYPPARDDAHL